MPVMGPIQSALVPAMSIVPAHKYRAVVHAEPKKERPRWLERFLSDCRDLWALITKGQPADDPLLPYRMMAELAKHAEPVDIDKWEADMFARSGVWWFDPARYDGTPFAWPKKVQPISQHGYWGLASISGPESQQAMMSQSAASGALQSAAMQSQLNAMSQLQAFQNQQYMNGFDQLNRFDMDFGLKLR